MPTVVIPTSPLAPGLTPLPIHVRDENAGRRDVPHAQIHVLDGAGHSPHSERAASGVCSELGASFLR